MIFPIIFLPLDMLHMKHMGICIINVSVNLIGSWLMNEVDLISSKISVS